MTVKYFVCFITFLLSIYKNILTYELLVFHQTYKHLVFHQIKKNIMEENNKYNSFDKNLKNNDFPFLQNNWISKLKRTY